MKLFGTDVLALTCIVGGGLVATGVTAAALGRNTQETTTGRTACALAVTGGAPAIAVSSDRIVLAPGVRVRGVVLADGSECGPGDVARIRVDLDRRRAGIERARVRVERARERVERVRLREVNEALASCCGDLDVVGEELQAALDGEIQARIEAEMKRLDATMKKLEGDLGGN